MSRYLEQLAFEEQQAIAQCLISKVVVTGEEVDIHFILPFASPPQIAQHLPQESEGANTSANYEKLKEG
jgi:hypothetical protein